MKEEKLKGSMIEGYERWLVEEEKSRATVEKYVRSVSHFVAQNEGRKIDKALVMEYKAELGKTYAATSANAILAAVNGFLRYWGLRQAVPGAEIPVLSRGKGTEPGGVRAAGESDERKAK